MTPEQLKASILQLAIQGKLVEQRPGEGTADELYRQIQAEKKRLIKEGKIKKDKPLPEIAEDEIPFDIPESWKWVRLGWLFQLINGDRGKNYPSKDKLLKKGQIPFISAINIDRQTVKMDGLLFVSEQQYNLLGSGKLQKNDFAFCLRGSLGKFCQYPFEIGAIASSLVILRKNGSVLDDYIKAYLSSPLIAEQINSSNNGTAQPNLGARDIACYLIPLPPLSEQKRIVAKIEELLPYIDRYAASYESLEQVNTEFPEDMKKSVLQYAIQGKLVEQRPEEGTGEELYRQIQEEKKRLIKEGKIKKEKPLPEIAEDEIPFDIPESWKWVRFSEIMSTMSTGPFGSMLHKTDYIEKGIPLVNPANMVNGKIVPSDKMMISEETRRRLSSYILHAGMIVLGRRGEMGRCAVVTEKEDGWLCGTGSFFMEPSMRLYVYYVFSLYSSPYVKFYLGGESVGTTMSNLNHTILSKMPIPLPPLAEQRRIVAKLDEILPLCERLK